MGTARAKLVVGGAVRPLQRRPLPPRHALPALAARQGARAVHDRASVSGIQRCSRATRRVGKRSTITAQRYGAAGSEVFLTARQRTELLTLLLAVRHYLGVAVRTDFASVGTPGQGLELLTRPIVLAVIAELEWGRQAHGLVTNGTTNPKRRTPPEGRARSLGLGPRLQTWMCTS